MRKIIFVLSVLFILFPLQAMAQNVVFNPGFDMTPWDTGWTVGGYGVFTDTFSLSKYVSPSQSCSLDASAYWDPYVDTYAGAEIYQDIPAVASCTCMVSYQYYQYGIYSMIACEAFITLLNNEDTVLWDTFAVADTWTKWEHIFGENDTINKILFGMDVVSEAPRVDEGVLLIDNVYVSGKKVGVEENKVRVESKELKVEPNPFTQKAFIDVGTRHGVSLQIYDLSGKLIEEAKSNIIGADLPPGIYFIKAKGYSPLKIIKLGETLH